MARVQIPKTKVTRFILMNDNIRFLLIVVLGYFIPLLFNYNDHPFFSSDYLLFDAPHSIAYTFLFWEGNYRIVVYLRRRYPEFSQYKQRLLSQVLLCTAYTSFVQWVVIAQFLDVIFNPECTLADQIQAFKKSLGMGYLVLAIYEGEYFFDKWKESIVKSEKLETEKVISQFEALKNQVSPHFLFNSLNTLITIIPEDQKLAAEFTQKLSNVYRYVLQNKDKDLVSLHDELNFVRAYYFLNQIRFGKNLNMEIQVRNEFLDTQIAPLSLQILIENAIKHNVISSQKPLSIDIYIEDGKIVVSNNLQQKENVANSTKTGLQNIINRYKLLARESVDVIVTSQNFMVSIPVLKVRGS